MEFNADNSFFHQSYAYRKIMLIVPHEDDEINTAGPLIISLTKSGADVSIVFTTNGDWKYSAETRMNEAIASSLVLGVPEEKVFFLGYGDAMSDQSHTHIFYSKENTAVSPAGFSTTYGVKEHSDYAFSKYGIHHQYTYENYLSDLMSIILDLEPEIIISSDFDEHPDHKMLSLCIDKAIGRIRKIKHTYNPEIWKSFAYSLAYTAIADYSGINNNETKKPVVGITGKYNFDIVNCSFYMWEERIRIPVPSEARTVLLKDNIIYKALCKHKSQSINSKASRIINSDDVYWVRRTDNLAYTAELSATSGDPEYVRDFVLYDVDDIDSVDVIFNEQYYWKPAESDTLKALRFAWNDPVNIEQIIIYSSISDDSSIELLKVSLSDGNAVLAEGLPANGNPLKLNLGLRRNIRWCNVEILKYKGEHYGIAECEIYAESSIKSLISPFVKILIGDNFAYEYLIDKNIKVLPLGLYSFERQDDVEISVIQGKSTICGSNLHVDSEDERIVLRAQNSKGTLYDQIIIDVADRKTMIKKSAADIINSSYIKTAEATLKLNNMKYILRNDGVSAVVKRTYKNVIKPRIMRKYHGFKSK